MSARPSRTTRSSTAAAAPVTGPSTGIRTRKQSSLAPAPQPPSTSANTARRTTRSSRSTTPAPPPEVKVTQTRISAARSAATTSNAARPLRISSRLNVASPPPPPPPTTPGVRRGASLAVPGSTIKPKTPGLLSRMTSRESLRQPKTPAAHSGAVGHLARASDGFEGPREPIKVRCRVCGRGEAAHIACFARHTCGSALRPRVFPCRATSRCSVTRRS